MTHERTSCYYIGLDLGKRQDYTALTALAEREVFSSGAKRFFDGEWEQAEFWLQHLHRWDLGTKYSTIAGDVRDLLRRDVFRREDAYLVIDRGGVGEAAFEQIEQEMKGLDVGLVSVIITGGDNVNQSGNTYRVPKRDLVAALQVMVQNDNLRAAEGMDLWPILKREMQSFTEKITETGHDTYEARQGAHDDLVLALAMPVWYAGYRPRWEDLTPIDANFY